MPKDALTIYRAAQELDVLIGGKIDKVNMPDRDTVLLLIHTKAGNLRLIMSCNPSLPRVHLTDRRYANPDAASGTLMFFRKRLAGAVITGIRKDKCERMITFDFAARDELLRPVNYKLACELTGKCANIIFIEDGKIGYALRRVTSEAPGKRAVLVGLPYTPPNATGRISVFERETFLARIFECKDMGLGTAVNKTVAGLAQTTVDEILTRSGLTDAPITRENVTAFLDAAAAFYTAPLSPTVSFDGDKPIDFFTEPYGTCGGELRHYPTLNAALDAYYSALFDAAEFAMLGKPLRSAVASAVKKNKKRLADAVAKLEESNNCDIDRQIGELITANIYKIKRGDTSVTVDNWFDNNTTLTIKLDNTKTPAQNAAVHFKQYTKKKKAGVYAQAALDAARDALFELDGIMSELDLCTTKTELDEVRAELVAMGLLRADRTKKKQSAQPSEPYRFDIDGTVLLVGKNHAQNDRITRSAAKTDIWLHVKDAHGCHAVLKTPSPTDAQLTRAAEIAAYYSQSRSADNVAVDYTQIRHVYPKGGGHVDYKEYKTLFVKPSAAWIPVVCER